MKKSLLIITGHSQGLGKAVLDYYLKQDSFQILAISRTKLEIKSPTLQQLSLDLADLDILESKLDQIFPDEEFDRIILLNNAGWIGKIKSLGKVNPKALRSQVNVNLLAPMYLTNAFIKRYKEKSFEKIICNIGSGAAFRPVAGWSGYCSTKAALAMFTEVAAKESASDNFHFFSLAPGIVDTGMQGEIRESTVEDFPELDKFIDFKKDNKLSSPGLVAQKIAYLFDNPSKFQDVIQDVRKFDLP
ncbi:SDR family NAD(P)-dependent oxidoreductase [Algoriphagus machipongonensis]|uniref:Oxidoreductase, short-chain dehydrogenase/reductase family n=1 Tax=Algoriphagus machipongonensis TaxID=388413 RepID=A3HWK6_9BACT|nr:SDR family NAD(P)-dependent oxidoreductase [Algoriphagus machipongonensis]EAZ80979.1 oxidoreductase, short-chain dehydrogenase/reductase family [Algoriphagus machipongonensis]